MRLFPPAPQVLRFPSSPPPPVAEELCGEDSTLLVECECECECECSNEFAEAKSSLTEEA